MVAINYRTERHAVPVRRVSTKPLAALGVAIYYARSASTVAVASAVVGRRSASLTWFTAPEPASVVPLAVWTSVCRERILTALTGDLRPVIVTGRAGRLAVGDFLWHTTSTCAARFARRQTRPEVDGLTSRKSPNDASRPDAITRAIAVARTRARASAITNAITFALIQAVLAQDFAVTRADEGISVANFVAFALAEARALAFSAAIAVTVASRIGAGRGAHSVFPRVGHGRVGRELFRPVVALHVARADVVELDHIHKGVVDYRLVDDLLGLARAKVGFNTNYYL